MCPKQSQPFYHVSLSIHWVISGLKHGYLPSFNCWHSRQHRYPLNQMLPFRDKALDYHHTGQTSPRELGDRKDSGHHTSHRGGPTLRAVDSQIRTFFCLQTSRTLTNRTRLSCATFPTEADYFEMKRRTIKLNNLIRPSSVAQVQDQGDIYWCLESFSDQKT
jgi:hypothetical protein